jgi:hypothetical protein
MGWASGSRLLVDIIKAVQKHVPDEQASEAVYHATIDALPGHGCDIMGEAQGVDPVFDFELDEYYKDSDE